MAGLGSGSFGLANNVTQNKSYMHMKLTDSAFKSIEEYLRIKQNSAASPKISFRGSEGEIIIPCRNNGTSKFSFTFQPIQESGGPQGSFEFIKQFSPRTLESLGPMVARLWIHAKDDTYEKTRKSMENAQKQGKMNCVKEVTNAAANPFVRQRPSHGKMNMVAPHKKKDIMGEQISSKFSSNNSTSPHRHQSGGTTGPPSNTSKPRPPPPPTVNGRNNNPDLVRRPLRERIIQLLAVKNYKKLELINRLHSDGIKEKDRRQMNSVLLSVSHVKENLHHLSRHLWSEVLEDWPFYTEKEKEAVKRKKPQQILSASDSNHSPTSAPPLSPSSEPQGVKRPHEEQLDPTAKRPRGGRWNGSSKSFRRKDESFPVSNEDKSEPHSDSWVSSKPKSTTPSSVLEHRQEARNGRHNNHHHNHRDSGSRGSLTNGTSNNLAANAITNTSTTSATITTSPARKPSSTSPLNQGSSPHSHHHLNGLHSHHNNHHHSSGSHSPINGVTSNLTNGHANHHSRTNGHVTPPDSSPDSLSGEDSPPAYLRNYTSIVSSDQRSRYKADFNRQYQEYLKLHSFIEERTRPFTDLEEQLRNETHGSEEYNTIRSRILRQYEATQQDHDFQKKKKRYNYLHEKLTHIKRLVRDYDANTHS
ncbi:RNA polymerase II elongation factor ELL-like isoform X2 [Portunus trituberculatus]|uniref:RNA polymerase II elongation factor ELL-like isoform X2 n=1 Tax=Portunus trituberculatus TaxID=210409 RepID=UPI001E1D0CEE|nr:RNA polymerase II elongation factor ELL-like isoform X2 [Portunus trituberculatus]